MDTQFQTYTRRAATVTARQYEGESALIVDSIRKGQQTAQKGDFLVLDPVEIAKLRAKEKDEDLPEGSLQPHRGSVYVVPQAEFLKDYEPAYAAAPTPSAEGSDNKLPTPPEQPPASIEPETPGPSEPPSQPETPQAEHSAQ